MLTSISKERISMSHQWDLLGASFRILNNAGRLIFPSLFLFFLSPQWVCSQAREQVWMWVGGSSWESDVFIPEWLFKRQNSPKPFVHNYRWIGNSKWWPPSLDGGDHLKDLLAWAFFSNNRLCDILCRYCSTIHVKNIHSYPSNCFSIWKFKEQQAAMEQQGL